MTLIKLLEAARAVGRWAFEHPRDALILLLAILLTFLSWSLKKEREHAEELAAKIEELPPNTSQVLTVYRDHIVTKWRDGPGKIEYRDRYLPPEGQIQMTTKVDSPNKQSEIVVQDHGFTERFGGGVVYSKRALPEIDIKWLYWRRYGLSLGITSEFGGLGISRHVDDLVPLRFDNLEILGLAGPDWSGKLRLGLGLRTNF